MRTMIENQKLCQHALHSLCTAVYMILNFFKKLKVTFSGGAHNLDLNGPLIAIQAIQKRQNKPHNPSLPLSVAFEATFLSLSLF